ncbi:MAG: PDZ domain-containing protein [Candidatus Dormibacteraceae bacterium]
MKKYEAFIASGEGASDALMDWLELHEIIPQVHDVRTDESALAEAVAIGAGRLPVVRFGERVVVGFDPAALELLGRAPQPTEAGLALAADAAGRLLVADVTPGGAGELLGLRPGDVITRLSGYTVFSAEQLDRALRARPHALVLGVRRGDEEFEVSLPSARRAA